MNDTTHRLMCDAAALLNLKFGFQSWYHYLVRMCVFNKRGIVESLQKFGDSIFKSSYS
jgi:hypothetical protein